jgi:hypothetical protein
MASESLADRFLRWWSPERLCRRNIARIHQRDTQRLRDARRGIPLREAIDDFGSDGVEWEDWLRQIESDKLERRGAKIGVYVEDQPLPDGQPFHHDDSPFGGKYLSHTSLVEFRRAVRAREPDYRKERRESWALILQVIVVLSGLAGTLTGLIVALKRK